MDSGTKSRGFVDSLEFGTEYGGDCRDCGDCGDCGDGGDGGDCGDCGDCMPWITRTEIDELIGVFLTLYTRPRCLHNAAAGWPMNSNTHTNLLPDFLGILRVLLQPLRHSSRDSVHCMSFTALLRRHGRHLDSPLSAGTSAVRFPRISRNIVSRDSLVRRLTARRPTDRSCPSPALAGPFDGVQSMTLVAYISAVIFIDECNALRCFGKELCIIFYDCDMLATCCKNK